MKSHYINFTGSSLESSECDIKLLCHKLSRVYFEKK